MPKKKKEDADLYFLGDEQTEIQVSEGLTARGFIGPWMATILARVGWTETDLDESYEWIHRDVSSTGKYRYYFTDYEAADAAREETGTLRVEEVWHWEIANPDIMNVPDETKVKWEREGWAGDVLIKSYSSPKRYELHQIALPAAVSVVARYMVEHQGREEFDVPRFDLSEIEGLTRDDVVSDEFQDRMIGEPFDREISQTVFVDYRFEESHLWKARAALWAALGEDNPKTWRTSGRQAVSSERLAACLSILHKEWTGPAYARVAFMQKPLVDDSFPIPVLLELFPDERAAREAANAELAEREVAQSKPTAPPEPEGDVPEYPEAWAGDPKWQAEWRQKMAEVIKPRYADHKIPAKREKAIQDDERWLDDNYGVEPDDVLAWWDAV